MWETIFYTSIVVIIMIFLILGVMYLLNIRTLKSQKQHYKSIHENLTVGKKVMVLNGIYGEVAKVAEETIELKLKSGQLMEVSRFAVSKILN